MSTQNNCNLKDISEGEDMQRTCDTRNTLKFSFGHSISTSPPLFCNRYFIGV